MKARLTRPVLVVSLAGLAAACGRDKERAAGEPPAPTEADSLRLVAAQKDSVTNALLTAVGLITSIDSTLAEARVARGRGGTPVLGTRSDIPGRTLSERIFATLDELTARLDSAESRVADLRTRLAAGGRRDSTLAAQVARYESTLGQLRGTIERQKGEVQSLTAQVAELRTRNQALADTGRLLRATVDTLSTAANTAFYVVGTRAQLIDLGIVQATGGARKLFGGRKGETLVPTGRYSADAFTALDIRRDTVVTLGSPGRSYQILSPQDQRLLAGTTRSEAGFQSPLRISEPQRFWQSSRYLIVLVQ